MWFLIAVFYESSPELTILEPKTGSSSFSLLVQRQGGIVGVSEIQWSITTENGIYILERRLNYIYIIYLCL